MRSLEKTGYLATGAREVVEQLAKTDLPITTDLIHKLAENTIKDKQNRIAVEREIKGRFVKQIDGMGR